MQISIEWFRLFYHSNIMYRKSLLQLMTAILVVLCFGLVSCSSDDVEEGSNISYTSDEIVELLKGEWVISGHVQVLSLESNEKTIDSDYTGTIEFTEAKKYKISSSKMPYKEKGVASEVDISRFLSHAGTYSILRKEGKTYLTLDNEPFLIVSLTKNSFRLIENEDVVVGYRFDGSSIEKVRYHYYITIVSI